MRRLNSLQSKNRFSVLIEFFVLIFIFLFLISSVSALKVYVSPSNLTFEGKYECKQIVVNSDEYIDFKLYDKWSGKRMKDVSEYGFSAIDFDILEKYPKYLVVDGRKEFDFCLESFEEGKYYGVLILEAVSRNIGIGVRIEVGNKKEENWIFENIFSGNSLKRDQKTTNFGLELVFLESIFVEFCLLVLLFLAGKMKLKMQDV